MSAPGFGALAGVVAAGVLALAPTCRAQVDSTELLFADTAVRAYSLTFYDTGWTATMEANWRADSGYVPARFTDGTVVLDSVGVRYKGNSSYTTAGNSPKKPYKIKFNEYRSQSYYATKTLNFSNGMGDPTFLREKIAYDIARRYLPAPRASFATITADGRAIGLYTQVEQVDKPFLKRWYADASKNLFKAGDDGASLQYKGSEVAPYRDSGDYELKTNETANDWSGFLRFVGYVGDTAAVDRCTGWTSWVDQDNLAKDLAFNMVLSNFDSYTGSGRNYYLYQVSDSGAMHILPWDVNLAFGGYSNNWDVIKQDLVAVDNRSTRPLTQLVLGCDSLRFRYLHWVRRMVQEQASLDSVKAAIARLAPIVRPFVQADSNKFYGSAAFETNLASNYRAGASTVIPGLVAFSTARNANLLAQVESYLPADYQVGVGPRPTLRSSVRLVRRSSGWSLVGLGDAGRVRVEWTGLDGRRLGAATLDAREGTLSLHAPRGLLVLRVRADGLDTSFLIHNIEGLSR